MDFYSNPNNFIIDDIFNEMSKNMVFFTLGKDYKFRPILYMYPSRLNSDDMGKLEHFMNIYLGILQKYVFKPYYIENWVIIIDLENKGLLNFPWKAIKTSVDTTNVNYAARLHKMFILNPSFIFNTTWNMIKGLIDQETVRKISFLKKKDFGLMQDVIPKNQLLKEYGGDLDRPLAAYPIRSTLNNDAVPSLTEEETNINNIFIDNTYEELTSRVKHNLKYHRFADMEDNNPLDKFETRSLRVIFSESLMGKEMSQLSANSYSRNYI